MRYIVLDVNSWLQRAVRVATCEANGIRIQYLRAGGAKPPVVLLHGLMGSGACWTPIARALERDFDVVMPDARGHGGSGAPPHGYGYEDHAADVVGLMRALGLERPVVLGHSMGGMTAAVVATRVPVRAVVLVDPTFLSAERQREVHASDVGAQHAEMLRLTKAELVARARARSPERSLEILELQADARLATKMAAFEVLAPPNPDYRALMREIHAPTLLVIGDSSPVVTLDMATDLRHTNPCVQLEVIAGAGHGVPFDQPEQLAAVVAAFLDNRIGTR